MLNKPHILTIKIFSTGDLPTHESLDALFTDSVYNLSLLSVEAVPMRFDGNGLVPVETPPTVRPEPIAAKTKSSPAPKVKGDKTPKEIKFEPGSDAEKVWRLIDTGPARTSTQIREVLGLGSNIVNTTIYRLKKAGMIRPMSHKAINGSELYTPTRLDK